MATPTKRGMDDALKVERRTLSEPLSRANSAAPMGQRLHGRLGDVATDDFTLPARQMPRTPPHWDEAE
jgi:hypothetical protein